AGLRQRPRLAVLAADDRRDEPLRLPGRRDLEQLARAAVDDGEAEAVRRLAGLLLDRDLAEHREARTAVLGRHVQHREAARTRLPAQLVDVGGIDRAARRDRGLDRVALGLDEAPDTLLQGADLGRQLGNDHPARAYRLDFTVSFSLQSPV